MKRLLLLLLRAYQYALSPLVGNSCRFAPTCSEYARQAVERHGAGRGSLLALWRLARCQPWCEGGLDPVPEQWRAWRSWRGSCSCGAPCSAPGQGGTPR